MGRPRRPILSRAVCSEQTMRNPTDEGGPMRKVVALELVSLDGVIEAPEEWAPPYSSEEM
jgi:hypothetical protein